ncbi:hypothetical protein ACHAXR_005830, partial [Thalassiosira sp. AJA248-18]
HEYNILLCHHLLSTTALPTHHTTFQYLARQLPHVKFILPTAPTQPVTLNMGMAMPSWYDIIGLDSRSNEDCKGLDDSMDRILGLLEDEAKSSVDYSRVVLAGFSQGGALALYTGMTQLRKQSQMGLGLAGIVVMSGYLPRSKEFAVAKGSENTPILHCHGREDSVVPVQATELSKARVTSLVDEMGGSSDSYEVKTYPGLDHSVSMDELNHVATFLRRVVPPIVDANKEIEKEDANDMVDPAQMSVRQLRDAIRKAGLEEKAKGMFEKSELIDLMSQHLKEKARPK